MAKTTLAVYEGTYEGDVDGGVPHGVGTMQYLNGSQYTGEWQQGKRHGVGVFLFGPGATGPVPQERTVLPRWAINIFSRHYVKVSSDTTKARYEGQWADDHMTGLGVFYHATGACYAGAMHASARDGPGVYLSPRGSIHIGVFAANRRQGACGKQYYNAAGRAYLEYHQDVCKRRHVRGGPLLEEAKTNEARAIDRMNAAFAVALTCAQYGGSVTPEIAKHTTDLVSVRVKWNVSRVA